MHHNQHAVKTKPPVLHQTTIVTFGDGKKLELNRRERRMNGIYGENIKKRYIFDPSEL